MTDTYGPATPTAPVPQAPRPGAGRKPDPNPFLHDVAYVVYQAEEGAPEHERAVSLPFTLAPGEEISTRWARIRRQLTKAGKIEAEHRGRNRAYQIDRAPLVEDGQGGYILTIWARL